MLCELNTSAAVQNSVVVCDNVSAKNPGCLAYRALSRLCPIEKTIPCCVSCNTFFTSIIIMQLQKAKARYRAARALKKADSLLMHLLICLLYSSELICYMLFLFIPSPKVMQWDIIRWLSYAAPIQEAMCNWLTLSVLVSGCNLEGMKHE